MLLLARMAKTFSEVWKRTMGLPTDREVVDLSELTPIILGATLAVKAASTRRQLERGGVVICRHSIAYVQ